MIGIVLAKIFQQAPQSTGTVDPCELSKSCSLKCLRSSILNCSSSKAEIPPKKEYIKYIPVYENFHILKYIRIRRKLRKDSILLLVNKMKKFIDK